MDLCAQNLNRSTSPLPQRIVKAMYSFPADVQLSDDCKDLITRIFVPDPNQRIKLQDIKQHPWFLMKLPKELQVSLDALWLQGLPCPHVECSSGRNGAQPSSCLLT